MSGFCSVKLEQEVGFCHGPREDLTHSGVERGRGGIFVLGERNLGDMLSGGAGEAISFTERVALPPIQNPNG